MLIEVVSNTRAPHSDEIFLSRITLACCHRSLPPIARTRACCRRCIVAEDPTPPDEDRHHRHGRNRRRARAPLGRGRPPDYSFPRAIPSNCRHWRRSSGPNVKVGTPREAAAFGDVVHVSRCRMARPPQVGRDYAAELKGKVVLDTGNPYPSRDGEMAVRDRAARHGRGVGGIPAGHAPRACFQCHQLGTARARGVPQARATRHSARRRRCGGDEDRRATRVATRASIRCPWANFPARASSTTARRSTCAA